MNDYMKTTNENLFGEQLCLGGAPVVGFGADTSAADARYEDAALGVGAVAVAATLAGVITKYALKKSTSEAVMSAIGVGAITTVVVRSRL